VRQDVRWMQQVARLRNLRVPRHLRRHGKRQPVRMRTDNLRCGWSGVRRDSRRMWRYDRKLRHLSRG
jgi:hypothetical protein